MSESKLNKTRVQPEIHKYPFAVGITLLLMNIAVQRWKIKYCTVMYKGPASACIIPVCKRMTVFIIYITDGGISDMGKHCPCAYGL